MELYRRKLNSQSQIQTKTKKVNFGYEPNSSSRIRREGGEIEVGRAVAEIGFCPLTEMGWKLDESHSAMERLASLVGLNPGPNLPSNPNPPVTTASMRPT